MRLSLRPTQSKVRLSTIARLRSESDLTGQWSTVAVASDIACMLPVGTAE